LIKRPADREPLCRRFDGDKLRAGRISVDSVELRILLPDLSVPVGVPALSPGGEDSSDVRARLARIVQRSTQEIVETVGELSALGIVGNARAQLRTGCGPGARR